MGGQKKAKKDSAAKAALKSQKKKAAATKGKQKATKAAKKSKDYKATEDDLLQTLADYRAKWEEEHRVTAETVGGPPSRRVNASLLSCPVSDNLWLFGGGWLESEDRCHFYNDMYRYTPTKDEWRSFASPNAPGPRSAHQLVATAAGGGKLWLFGGEFSALNQSAFHHYRDFWQFDIATCAWERMETRVRPSARSGHRMCAWRHLLILFGGFHDAGVKTQYLGDLWVFNTTSYEWKEIIVRDVDRRPSARSGFSFLPTADGIVLHGGYRKEYVGKRATGVALDDTWLLRIDPNDLSMAKWERRKKSGFAPSVRSGCTMTLWHAKGMGVLFGGVFDDDKDEETLESAFYNDLYGYQLANGRWSSFNLRKKKRKGKAKSKPAPAQTLEQPEAQLESDIEMDAVGASDREADEEIESKPTSPVKASEMQVDQIADEEEAGPPVPRERYNAMLAVQRNTLYLYGGILESRSREAALSDFWTLDMAKLDEWKCLRDVEIEWEQGLSDDEEGPPSDEESDFSSVSGDEIQDDEMKIDERVVQEPSEREQADLRRRADAFLAASKAERSEEERLSTPLPGENLRIFYERSREYWTQRAHQTSDNRGKLLRRDGFQLADERYEIYKPILQELERIQASAGLDEAETTTAQASSAVAGASRSRR